MQLISEEICALIAAMSVINSEKAYIGPTSFQLLALGSQNIQDDADSVFVVSADVALMGIGRVRQDAVVFLGGVSSGFD
jgi:hypothetical protein